MRIRTLIFVLLLSIARPVTSFGQSMPDSTSAKAAKITQNYINAISAKSAKLSADMDKSTQKYLDQLQKQENKIKNKLAKVDSVAAHNIFADADKKYQNIESQVKNKSSQLIKSTGTYLPWLDSAGTSLKFLAGKNPLISSVNGNAAKVSGALGKVKTLENEFKQAGSVKEFIRQRKEYLAQQLKNYDLGSDLKKYNQTAYYYTQQLNDYKKMMDDPERAESKAMTLLQKIPAFQKFFHDHSELAGLFDVPSDYGTTMAPGLQTKQQVQKSIQTRIQGMGPNGKQMVSQSLSAAQSELSKLRNRYPSSGSVSDMPDFTPKTEKTKTFLRRLEYGTNIQTVNSSYYFPTTTNFALSVGYKISEKNVIGIGASYMLGWGNGIKHIALSSQGIGFRSFANINLKRSLYVTSGFEYNYQQPFASTRELYALQNWQKSALLGLSKIVNLKTKFFKKTTVQVLWDALSYSQIPKGAPFKFRVGYSF